MPYTAARFLRCSPDTIKKRIVTSPAVAEVVRDEQGLLLDIAEVRLAEAVLRGDPWAIQFTLATRGKHRGYGRNAERDIMQRLLQTVERECEEIARETEIPIDEVLAEVQRILQDRRR
jgi:hypothetical protein